MSKDILQLGDFEHTMFIHLYEAYQELVNAVGAGENEYERLKKIDVMYTAWEKANLPSGEYASKKYIQNIQAKYAQLWYWKNMLNKYLGDRYAEHQQAPHECPSVPKYPAGYEQAFQSIVFQSLHGLGESEQTVRESIDWSKFCHLHEQLRKIWDIELSTTHYVDATGEPKKLGTRTIKDQPQA